MFVHLRNHSEFSVIDGLTRIPELAARAAEYHMPAVALTDHANLFALVKFYQACQRQGVKPLCGADLWVVEDDAVDNLALVTFLVQNDSGYRNLTQLISRAHQEGQRLGHVTLHKSWLAGQVDGLLALSGAREGDIGRALLAGKNALAQQRLQYWQSLFGDRFYIELQRTNRAQENAYTHAAVALAQNAGCAVVATNDVRFLEREQFGAHEARVCITEGRTLDDPRRPRHYSEEQYFRSSAEMGELFADLPEALENSVEIAKRCNLTLQLDQYFLPDYPIPAGLTLEEFFRREAEQGLEQRLQQLEKLQPEKIARRRNDYTERLNFELGIINQMGFPGYFLIVMDFIRWAKEQGIPVGPGRGSGAGSVVAYALQITDLDPLEYDLLFERFLNPERVSLPDFDVDFCMEGRDSVIGYVADRYGRDAVAQIITFGTMAAKAVVRDVARVQGKAYGLADKLSKLIPFEIGMTLSKGMQQDENLREFVEQNEEAAEIMEMAYQLEGIARNVGKHAGGVVIAPTRLTDFAPLYCDESGAGLVTQFDKDDVERVGLVKFDFLGLRTLTIIDWALKIVNKQRREQNEPELDMNGLPLDDAATFKLLQNAGTTAIFQLESRGMKDLIKRLLPSCFEDIIALVALFRPGPLQSGMVDDFINRKHGRAAVKYDHPSLEPVLKNTYGVILYQEQVMQIAQVMANYTLGQADLLRRAMGKKKAQEMAKQKQIFCDGAEANGIEQRVAERVFDLMEKFAGYGFNKSHSAAYALLSYQTAWLKTQYPAAFMAAVLSADMQNTDKVVQLIEECRSMGLSLVMPDINRGEYAFSVDADQNIVYGLGAIKGLGEGPIESILAARASGGVVTDLFDFCSRTDARKVNRRATEALIRAGAFDSLGTARSVLAECLDDALRAADQSAKNRHSGMTDLFGEVHGSTEDAYAEYRQAPAWSAKEMLAGEKDTLGLYLSGHPIDEYADEVAQFNCVRLIDVRPGNNAQLVVGLIVALRTMKSKKGDTFAFITLDDRTARLEVAIFADLYQQVRDKLIKDTLVSVTGFASVDDYSDSYKMRATSLQTLMESREAHARALQIKLQGNTLDANALQELQHVLETSARGSIPVSISYETSAASAQLALGEQWRVVPSDEFIQRLRSRYGIENVQLQFDSAS